MYRDGAFNEKDSVKILPFITSHLLPGLSSGTRLTSDTASQILLEDIESILRDLPVCNESLDAARTGNGNLWNAFVYRHCEVVNLHDLDAHFSKLSNVGTPPSLFRAFMDRMRLSYQQLRFENQMWIWHDFAQHRSGLIEKYKNIFQGDALRPYRLKIASHKRAEADPVLEQSLYTLIARGHENSNAAAVGEEELNTVLQFQIEQMQRECRLFIAYKEDTNEAG